MNKNTYDIILWDLDGTIIQSHPGIFNGFIYALDKFGIKETQTDKLYCAIGPGIQDTFKDLYNFSEQDVVTATDYYREYYSEKGVFEYNEYEGIVELIKKAKSKGKIIALATAKPKAFAEVIIENLGLTQFFDYIGGNIMAANRLTKSQVISLCFENLKITDKSKVVLVGDTKYDTEGAIKSGIDCIGVLYGYGDEKQLQKATHIATDMKSLEELLLG